MNISTRTFAAFALIVFTGLSFTFLPSMKFLINFSSDDSFFYIKTAYNFSQGYGSTFDLVNLTNGYHPLWFLILSLYFFIINFFNPFNPDVYFRFVVLLQYGISVLTLYFAYKSFNILKENPKKSFFIFLVFFLIIVFTRDLGLESQLLCLLYSMLIFCKAKEVYLNSSLTILKVLLINLLFLTRIDLLISIVPAIIIGDYFTTNNIERKKLVISYISLIVILTGYFLMNKLFFGHLLTISARIENSFPENLFSQNFSILFQPGYLTNHFLKLSLVFFSLIIFIINFKNQRINTPHKRMQLFLFSACAGALIFLILNLSFNKQGLREWYVTFPAYTALLMLFFTFNIAKKYYLVKICLTVLCFAAYFYLTRIANSKWDSSYDYAVRLKEVTSPEDRILQMDMSGIVGFFSERKIINGDGFINSFEYWNYVSSNNLEKYLKDKQINFYSTHSEDDNFSQLDFTDKIYSNNVGGYHFTFSVSDLVFKMPFSYNHVINKNKGEWYLFKIKN